MAAGNIGGMTQIGARGGPAPHGWDIPEALVTVPQPEAPAANPLAAALLG